MSNQLMSVADVAAMVGCSPRSVRRAIAAGRLLAVQPTGPTGRYKVRRDDYENWLTGSEVKAPPVSEPSLYGALTPRATKNPTGRLG